MPQPLRRGQPRRLPTLVLALALGIAVLLLSCSGDNPIEPPRVTPELPTEAAAAKGGGNLKFEENTLSVEEMLSDPLFQALVNGIDVPTLSEPLMAAVDALASGQTAKARNLIDKAATAADALEDAPVVEALILWSAVVRFLEEAELI